MSVFPGRLEFQEPPHLLSGSQTGRIFAALDSDTHLSLSCATKRLPCFFLSSSVREK